MKFYVTLEEIRIKEFVLEASSLDAAENKIVELYETNKVSMSDALPYCVNVGVVENENDMDIPCFVEHMLNTLDKTTPREEVTV